MAVYVLREPEACFAVPGVPEDTPEEMLEAICRPGIGGYRIQTTITGKTARAAIFPWWTHKNNLPQTPRRLRSPEEIAAANERRSIQRGEDLICTNFGKGDTWFTGTWGDAHLPQDEAGQLRYVQNFVKRLRRRHLKNGGKRRDFWWLFTLEADAAEGVRLNMHMALRGELSLDEVEELWRGGGRNQTRRIVPDQFGVIGMAVYMTKPEGKNRRRRWYASTGLKQPDVRVANKKTTKAEVRTAAEARAKLEAYFEKLYPGWEITRVADPRYNDNGGVYLYAQLRVREDLPPGERAVYVAAGRETSRKKNLKPLH